MQYISMQYIDNMTNLGEYIVFDKCTYIYLQGILITLAHTLQGKFAHARLNIYYSLSRRQFNINNKNK